MHTHTYTHGPDFIFSREPRRACSSIIRSPACVRIRFCVCICTNTYKRVCTRIERAALSSALLRAHVYTYSCMHMHQHIQTYMYTYRVSTLYCSLYMYFCVSHTICTYSTLNIVKKHRCIYRASTLYCSLHIERAITYI